MDHYIDIRILPDAEMRENVLLNTVYTKLHKVLYDLHSTDIGVSFPEYKIKLGRVLRIHGKKQRLTVLQQPWLGGLSGYCQISSILPVPESAQHRIISRVQSTMSPAKLRRLLKRGSITDDKKKEYKIKMLQKGLDNPFFELESSSNGKKYRRYIKFGEILPEPLSGTFDQFGLSKNATVPWFN